MPTSRKRHVITETDEVARALDDAAQRWPEERGNRPRLLLRLVQEGHRAVAGEQHRRGDERRQALAAASGACTGAYGPDYLTRLRAEWPE